MEGVASILEDLGVDKKRFKRKFTVNRLYFFLQINPAIALGFLLGWPNRPRLCRVT